jgi:hypothetical protein
VYLTEQPGRHPLRQGTGGAQCPHARDGPGIVADGVCEDEALHELGVAHREYLSYAAAEIVTADHGSVFEPVPAHPRSEIIRLVPNGDVPSTPSSMEPP